MSETITEAKADKKWTTILIATPVRDQLSLLRGDSTYTEALTSLINIIFSFNDAFKTIPNQKLIDQLGEEFKKGLDRAELKIFMRLVEDEAKYRRST